MLPVCVSGFLFLCLLLGFWTLFRENILRLPLCLAPRLTALQRLKRFVHSGKPVRVVCFGNPAEGKEPGFHFVFDAAVCGKLCLEVLTFSDITPPSAVKMAGDYQGRTAEAYCYHQGRGIQLIGTLDAALPQVRLIVRKVRLSGRAKEIDIKPGG